MGPGFQYMTLGQGGFNNSALPGGYRSPLTNPMQAPDRLNYQSLYGNYFDTPQEVFGQNTKTNPLGQYSNYDQLPDWATNYFEKNRPQGAYAGSYTGGYYQDQAIGAVNGLNGQDPFYLQNHIDPSTFQNGYINYTTQHPFTNGVNTGEFYTGLADPISGRFLPGQQHGQYTGLGSPATGGRTNIYG